MPNTTEPPPAPLAAQIAFCMAAVSSVCPSPLAPNEFTDAPTHTACEAVPKLAQRIQKRTIVSLIFTVFLLSSLPVPDNTRGSACLSATQSHSQRAPGEPRLRCSARHPGRLGYYLLCDCIPRRCNRLPSCG